MAPLISIVKRVQYIKEQTLRGLYGTKRKEQTFLAKYQLVKKRNQQHGGPKRE